MMSVSDMDGLYANLSEASTVEYSPYCETNIISMTTVCDTS